MSAQRRLCEGRNIARHPCQNDTATPGSIGGAEGADEMEDSTAL